MFFATVMGLNNVKSAVSALFYLGRKLELTYPCWKGSYYFEVQDGSVTTSTHNDTIIVFKTWFFRHGNMVKGVSGLLNGLPFNGEDF